MYKNIIFWLEYPLFHISPLIKQLSLHPQIKVIAIFEKKTPGWRLDMGFNYPDFGNAEIISQPNKLEREQIVSNYSTIDSVHIFHGLRSNKENFKCFRKLIKSDCTIGLYFEALKINRNLKGLLQTLYYKNLFFTKRKYIDFILALGDLGKKQFIKLGMPKEKVFSFNYFIASDYLDESNILNQTSKKDLIRLIYVGRLIDLKNVSLLLESFKEVCQIYDNLTLTIVGDGTLKSSLKQYVNSNSLTKKVQFIDYISNSDLKDTFTNHDIHILPSKFDGWGAVAVEAISRGLFLILSDKCGSATIIKDHQHGIVFKSGSRKSLTKALIKAIDNEKVYLNHNSRAYRRDYAYSNLTASAGERMLFRILDK